MEVGPGEAAHLDVALDKLMLVFDSDFVTPITSMTYGIDGVNGPESLRG